MRLCARTLSILAALCVPLLAHAGTVLYVSDPVRPGETVMVIGDGFQDVKSVRLVRLSDGDPGKPGAAIPTTPGAIEVRNLQPRPQSLKFVIPASQLAGVFRAEVTDPTGKCAFLVNVAQPVWLQGDTGVTATPGGSIRAFGRCLAISKHVPSFYLRGPRGERHIAATEATEWDARAKLPADLPEGDYTVWLHNGCGGPAGWSAPLTIAVQREKPWPKTVYNVRDLGADGTGSIDSTEAVKEALARCAKAGGGVVYFPRGRYMVTATLEIPRSTVLRGEARELVNVFWPDSDKPLVRLLSATNSIGVEDLTFYASNYQHFLVTEQGKPDSGDVHVRRIRFRGDPYRGHPTPEQVNERFTKSLALSTGGGDSLCLGGRNVEVTDSDIYGAGRCLYLSGGRGANIARNTLYNGRWGWYCISGSDGVVFEDNRIIGADLMSTGGGLNCLDGSKVSQNVFYARNKLSKMYGWDREAMTSDAGGGTYYGALASADANSVTLAEDPKSGDKGWIGAALFILDGKGRGQYRIIRAFAGRRVEVDKPWQVTPDTTSRVTVTMLQRNYMFIGNSFSDAGIAIQMYGMSIGNIAAGNTCERAGGYHNHGMDYMGVQPSWYVQWLDNEIAEGNQEGVSHLGVLAIPPSGNFADCLTLGCVVRRNRLRNNAGIEVGAFNAGFPKPIVQDVIVEHNIVENADTGIIIRRSSAGVLTRENDCRGCVKGTEDEEALLAAFEKRRQELLKDPGPIAYWSFDALKGKVIPDVTGHGLDAHPDGAVTLVDGVKGKAASFDGKSLLRCDQGPLLNLDTFTLSAWIKPSVVPGRWGILAKRGSHEAAPFVLGIMYGAISFEATNFEDGKWSWNFNSPPVIKPNVWQHIAAVVQEGKGVTLYYNGKAVATHEHAGKVTPNGSDLMIGKEVWGGDPPSADKPGFYTGLIDEVKIWARALTAEEVAGE